MIRSHAHGLAQCLALQRICIAAHLHCSLFALPTWIRDFRGSIFTGSCPMPSFWIDCTLGENAVYIWVQAHAVYN